MWKDFFERLALLRKTGESFVAATVVKVSGSTYRRPGARVLITKDGSTTGLISGGCFESDLIEKARKAIENGKKITVTFDTTSPDDLLFGLGLGCTGVAQILLEPFQTLSGQEHLDFIAECIRNRRKGIMATVFRAEGESGVSVGSRAMVQSGRHHIENIENPDVVSLLLNECDAALAAEESDSRSIQFSKGACEALLEAIPLPTPLVIFGAGPDAVPLVRFAKQLGWNVTVVDRRPAFVRPDRFPAADSIILSEPADLAKNLVVDARTVAVLMTHHYETDVNYLKHLLSSQVCYIGLLGPSAKAQMLLQHLRDEGFPATEEQLSRIYNPIGLDLGAETPEEIALSIVAEIQAIQTGYPAGFLRNRTGPIHPRAPVRIQAGSNRKRDSR